MPSSVIRDFEYESEALELTITFVSGRIYVYLAVPAEVYDYFSTAFSKGTFFNHPRRPRVSRTHPALVRPRNPGIQNELGGGG